MCVSVCLCLCACIASRGRARQHCCHSLHVSGGAYSCRVRGAPVVRRGLLPAPISRGRGGCSRSEVSPKFLRFVCRQLQPRTAAADVPRRSLVVAGVGLVSAVSSHVYRQHGHPPAGPLRIRGCFSRRTGLPTTDRRHSKDPGPVFFTLGGGLPVAGSTCQTSRVASRLLQLPHGGSSTPRCSSFQPSCFNFILIC